MTESKKSIAVFLDWLNGRFHDVSHELICEALRLSEILDDDVILAGAGQGISDGAKLIQGYKVSRIILCQVDYGFNAESYAQLYYDIIKELDVDAILIGGTYEGRSVAPRLAVKLNTGLTADCTSFEVDENNRLIQIRPAFGGNCFAKIVTKDNRVQISTVRPGVFPAGLIERAGNIVLPESCRTSVKCDHSRIIEETADNGNRLSEAKLVFAIGKGVRKKEDIQLFRKLAAKYGAVLGSSRSLVDKGWMKRDEQIGLSGGSLKADLLITFGISGSVQFMAGTKAVKHIIAINSDKDARIFQSANESICSDMYEVADEMMGL